MGCLAGTNIRGSPLSGPHKASSSVAPPPVPKAGPDPRAPEVAMVPTVKVIVEFVAYYVKQVSLP